MRSSSVASRAITSRQDDSPQRSPIWQNSSYATPAVRRIAATSLSFSAENAAVASSAARTQRSGDLVPRSIITSARSGRRAKCATIGRSASSPG